MPQLPNSIEPNWTPDPKIAAWATKQGFGEPVRATDSDFRSFSRAYGGAATGLYLWEDSQHHIYIGISRTHVVHRMRSHVKSFLPVSNIQQFRYRPEHRSTNALRELERSLVHDAVKNPSAFVVMNREHAAMVVGDSVLNDVVSQKEQESWLEDPTAVWPRSRQRAADGRTFAAENSWTNFTGLSESEEIIDAVALYARLCVPYAARTVYDWWVVTCPGWRKNGFERVCTVNMAFLEMLWFSRDLASGKVTVSVGTDLNFLPTLWSTKKLNMHPVGQRHRSGGPLEEVIQFATVSDFADALIRSAPLRRGAANFALDRMRRGRVGGRYMASHNPQLATAVLNRADQLKIAPVEEGTIAARLPRGWFERKTE